MRDLTGRFNRVIMETKAESLAELGERMKEYMSTPGVEGQDEGLY